MPHKIEIMEFTRRKSFREYLDNRILQLAIEREFEIIGEALNRLERTDLENLAQKIPEYNIMGTVKNRWLQEFVG